MNDIQRQSTKRAQLPAVKGKLSLVRQDGKRPDGATLFLWAMGKPLPWDVTVPDIYADFHLYDTACRPAAAAHNFRTVTVNDVARGPLNEALRGPLKTVGPRLQPCQPSCKSASYCRPARLELTVLRSCNKQLLLQASPLILWTPYEASERSGKRGKENIYNRSGTTKRKWLVDFTATSRVARNESVWQCNQWQNRCFVSLIKSRIASITERRFYTETGRF